MSRKMTFLRFTPFSNVHVQHPTSHFSLALVETSYGSEKGT